jgi:uncharacterized protein YjbI with pentapeptide repeats
MAKKRHVDLIKKSAEEWKRWREKHPDKRADLRGVNLREANLCEADLEEADLEEAIGITIEQLSKARTLKSAELDPKLMGQIKNQYPHLV